MSVFELLASISLAPGGAETDSTGQLVQMIGMFVLVGAILAILIYFLLVRPQRRQSKESVGSTSTDSAPSDNFADQVTKRYADAYLIARMVTALGDVVKRLGIVLAIVAGVVGVVLGIKMGQREIVALFFGVIAGFFVGIPFFVLGIFVSAHGQVLKASLDNAVHTSPFLDEAQKAKVMSLR